MQFLSIGVNEYTNDSINYLVNELNKLNPQKVKLKTTLIKSTSSRFIICKLKENKIINALSDYNFGIMKQYTSFILSNYIIKYYEEKLLNRIINMNYCYFNHLEKKQILDFSTSILKSNENNKINLYTTKHRNLIFKKLLEYFENSNEIILDGFINFRIKEYIIELEDVVDKAVDIFLMEREYQEFIRLLRYFVDIQEPKFEAVHILPSYEDKFIILDHFHNEITNDCIKEFLNEVPEEEINHSDLLVSSLITIAPIRIYIHDLNNIKNKELIETIKNVFVNKVIFCNGCHICKVHKVNIETLTK